MNRLKRRFAAQQILGGRAYQQDDYGLIERGLDYTVPRSHLTRNPEGGFLGPVLPKSFIGNKRASILNSNGVKQKNIYLLELTCKRR